ncbi:MAG: ABC transporter substrate-binding protein [Streptosporangiales bacterium]
MRRQGSVSRRNLLKGAVAGAAGAVFVPACGNSGSGAPGADSASKSATGISVEDQRGKTITLDHPARRVVTLPMPAAAMLIAVDRGADHLVGMHKFSWVAIRDGILGDFFPKAENIAHGIAGQNFTPNVESIVGLNPDVVVQWGDEGAGIIAPMENAGLKVVGLTYGTQQDVNTWITLFGTLLGKKDRADAINGRTSKQLDEIKAAAAKASGPKPKIIYFNRFKGGLKAAGKGSYNDFYIRLVGGENAAAQLTGLASVDIEQVLTWDPDVVLLGNFDDTVPDDVYGDKVWSDVSAVKSKRVYKVPLGGYRWDPPSQESPLMWRWLFGLAHPQAKPYDLRGQVTSYYNFLYGHEPSDKQLDKVLWMDLNAKSSAYRQFHAG